jgi:anti-sigma B factor antagonist
MNTPSAKLSVLIGQQFACVKISGRANFTSSIDFKSVVQNLRDKGYTCFVLDLSECTLMDSTFLGLLAGFGLKMRGRPENPCDRGMVLLNPSPRITELLESLGVLDLFRITQGTAELPPEAEAISPTFEPHGHEEVTRACLEAHQILSSLSPENAAKFRDVTQFLAEDLKKIKKAEPA